MKISRDVSGYIHFVLDELLPPVVRDWGWFMKPLLRLSLGKHYSYFVNFKEVAHDLTEEEFCLYYEKTYGILDRETDLNRASIKEIFSSLQTENILEVGCGNGYLAGRLADVGKTVTACDINISDETKTKVTKVNFVVAPAESLPFCSDQFSEVVCTHTLEHVRNLPAAIAELRRVTKERLVIVVPAQRPYRYTFDLHLHFFPYEFSLRQVFLPDSSTKVTIKKVSGDWFYMEEYNQ